MRKAVTGIVAVALAAAGIGWAIYTTRATEALSQRPDVIPTMVDVARASAGPIQKTVRYVATVEAAESVTILPKVTGILDSIHVDLGDHVEKGQLIAKVVDEEFIQRLKQAQANLELAEAQLARSRINLGVAEREKKRTESASSQGLTTEKELDTAVAGLDTAKADVTLAEAEVSRAKAALEEAQINVQNTQIVSPMTGTIDKRRVDAGSLVSPSTPICTVVRSSPAKIIVNVPESEIYLAQTGTTTLVDAAGVTNVIRGQVDRVSPTVDMSTHTTEVEISVPNEDGALRPGMSADVTFVARQKQAALLIPESALLRSNNSLDVLRIDGDIVKRIPVRAGISSEGKVEVLDGLEEGDLVVVKGQFLVEDGDPVRYENGPVKAPSTTREGT